jgi:uracil-DNA glycosylase family 4
MFTGDRSGDWLYRAMHRAGFASQPESSRRGDGLELSDAWVTSAVRCAPPQNKPLPAERDNCEIWFDRELDLLSNVRVFVCLGGYAYAALMRRLVRRGHEVPRPRPRFGHGAAVLLPGAPLVLSSYHPSQQNTFTGRLTESMLDEVFNRARSAVLEIPEGH